MQPVYPGVTEDLCPQPGLRWCRTSKALLILLPNPCGVSSTHLSFIARTHISSVRQCLGLGGLAAVPAEAKATAVLCLAVVVQKHHHHL